MGKKSCAKEAFGSENEAFVASLKVPVSPTGQQPIACYRCQSCSRSKGRDIWHFTSKSQIKPRNRGTRRSRRN